MVLQSIYLQDLLLVKQLEYMTFDGRTGMSLTWNDLGLVEKVSLNDTVQVNYSYLADGTKVSALDGDGDGLLYLGSLIYRKTGSHWNTTASLTDQTNRFRYNSKEEQSSLYPASVRNAVSYIDYGARQYDPILGRWFAQDPLAEKYYGISPYAFCAGNPVKYLDFTGEAYGDPVKNPEIRRNQASNLYGSGIRVYNGEPRNHQGFDYYAPVGTDVLSVKDGIVVQIVEGHKDYGTSVTIEHIDEEGNAVYSFYAHLSEVGVNMNDIIEEGDVIAKSGTSGNAKNMTGKDQHLHFELRDQKGNAKGLVGKRNPNEIVDTKFVSQDPNAPKQKEIGIIKIYKDGREEIKNLY